MDNKPNKKQKKIGIFLFHRDFRLTDNVGIITANQECDILYPVFLFTVEQIGRSNPYKSNNAIQFMLDSLESLETEIGEKGGHLHVFLNSTSGITGSIQQMDYLLDKWGANSLYFNQDYTPYAVERDQAFLKLCERKGVECKMCSDYYLLEPGTVMNQQKIPYRIFSAFYAAFLGENKQIPTLKRANTFKSLIMSAKSKNETLQSETTLNKMRSKLLVTENKMMVQGGRINGLRLLQQSGKTQNKYSETRDYMAKGTSHLSAYLKFGCVSVREVYYYWKRHFGVHSDIVRQLVWREFFTNLLYYYGDDCLEQRAFDPKYRKLPWLKKNSTKQSAEHFKKWCEGKTGVPIVDAAMRELNTTGYMHNRSRMIVANFLIKTLLLDWRLGEQYFAQKLIDYDIASNNGNWQSIMGGGAYQTPYFRVMNPWIQSAKFDSDAEYIKKWVPELTDVPVKIIHKWYDLEEDEREEICPNYPSPIADYWKQKEKVLALYKKYLD